MELLLLIGIVFAFFFAVLIFNKKHKSISDKILGTWLLILGIHLINPFLIYRKIMPMEFGGISGFLVPVHLAFIYIYTRSLTTENFKLQPKHLIHLFAPILFMISMIPYLMLPPEVRNDLATHASENMWKMILPAVVNMIFFIVYTVYSYLLVRKHQKKVDESYSYHKNVDLRWLKNIISGTMIITVGFIILVSLFSSKNMDALTVDLIFFSLFSLFIIMIGFWGFKQGKIFVYMDPNISHQFVERAKIQKEEKPEITDNVDYTPIVEKITSQMETGKSFLDQELTLEKFANEIDLSIYELSKILNNVLECNFYNFVNRYRVEEFKNRVADEQYSNLTLLGIAYDCGFNSKASFNRIFKKFTNHTPSDYKKHVMEQQS